MHKTQRKMDRGPKRDSEDGDTGGAHGAAFRPQMSRELAAVCGALGPGRVSALTPKVRVIKVKTEKLALIKTESICLKDIIKTSPQNGRNSLKITYLVRDLHHECIKNPGNQL